MISWKGLSLPTNHNTSDYVEEKQDQAIYLEISLSLSTKEQPKEKFGSNSSKLWIFMIILGQTNKKSMVTEI